MKRTILDAQNINRLIGLWKVIDIRLQTATFTSIDYGSQKLVSTMGKTKSKYLQPVLSESKVE